MSLSYPAIPLYSPPPPPQVWQQLKRPLPCRDTGVSSPKPVQELCFQWLEASVVCGHRFERVRDAKFVAARRVQKE
jgi:hypothetical protein